MTDSNQTETVFAIGKWTTNVNERLDKMDGKIDRLESLETISGVQFRTVWDRLDRISSRLLMLEHSKSSTGKPDDQLSPYAGKPMCPGCNMSRRSSVEIKSESGCLYCRVGSNTNGPGSSALVTVSPDGFLMVRPVDSPSDDDWNMALKVQ